MSISMRMLGSMIGHAGQARCEDFSDGTEPQILLIIHVHAAISANGDGMSFSRFPACIWVQHWMRPRSRKQTKTSIRMEETNKPKHDSSGHVWDVWTQRPFM